MDRALGFCNFCHLPERLRTVWKRANLIRKIVVSKIQTILFMRFTSLSKAGRLVHRYCLRVVLRKRMRSLVSLLISILTGRDFGTCCSQMLTSVLYSCRLISSEVEHLSKSKLSSAHCLLYLQLTRFGWSNTGWPWTQFWPPPETGQSWDPGCRSLKWLRERPGTWWYSHLSPDPCREFFHFGYGECFPTLRALNSGLQLWWIASAPPMAGRLSWLDWGSKLRW